MSNILFPNLNSIREAHINIAPAWSDCLVQKQFWPNCVMETDNAYKERNMEKFTDGLIYFCSYAFYIL